jgi:hypothetical protein
MPIISLTYHQSKRTTTKLQALPNPTFALFLNNNFLRLEYFLNNSLFAR